MLLRDTDTKVLTRGICKRSTINGPTDIDTIPVLNYALGMTDTEDFEPQTGALAWTSDEDMEAGVARFKELWPEKWEAWVAWCREQDEKGELEND